MTEQELRDEFEKWAMANFNIAPELISDFKYSFTHRLIHAETAFLKGYSLAQETIKAKDAEIERLKSTFAGYENFQREKQLEQELQKTRERLEKAESVVKFYADINNWTGEDINGWNCTNVIKEDDQEILETVWIKGCGTEKDIYDDCGGKRARQYFKDKQGE